MTNGGELGRAPSTTSNHHAAQVGAIGRATEQHTLFPHSLLCIGCLGRANLRTCKLVFILSQRNCSIQRPVDSPIRQLRPSPCLHEMLTWESKFTAACNIQLPCLYRFIAILTLPGKNRSSPSTSARPRASKKSRPNVRPSHNPRPRDRSLSGRRKACTSMHCVHMGSQELPELLAGHESVG
jgi:hypothetical protein